MKKALSILLALMLLLTLCACGNDDPSTEPETTPSTENTAPSTEAPTECTHDYTEAVTKEATCSEEGVKTFTCSKCGDSYTEAIEKIDHSYTETITKEATCTEEGVKTYTCAGCGDSYTESIAKVDHNWKNATCTAPKTCTSCGATEGSAAGHNWKNATCTAPKTCTTCGATEGSKSEHNYVDGVCSGCGDIKIDLVGTWMYYYKDENGNQKADELKFYDKGVFISSCLYFDKVINFYYNEYGEYTANCEVGRFYVGKGPDDTTDDLYTIDGEYYVQYYSYIGFYNGNDESYVVSGNTVTLTYTPAYWDTPTGEERKVVFTLNEDGNLVNDEGHTYVKVN